MKIINKTEQSWVAFDRSLMRDTRIKSHHKVLYLLFKSFAQSCDNVFLSYSYIAQEVGYEYNGKHPEGSQEHERAMKKFVSDNLQPLIELGWIKKINNQGESCDWEVYDHDCNREQKSTHPMNKKVHGTVNKKVHLDKRREIKEVVDDFSNQKNWTPGFEPFIGYQGAPSDVNQDSDHDIGSVAEKLPLKIRKKFLEKVYEGETN